MGLRPANFLLVIFFPARSSHPLGRRKTVRKWFENDPQIIEMVRSGSKQSENGLKLSENGPKRSKRDEIRAESGGSANFVVSQLYRKIITAISIDRNVIVVDRFAMHVLPMAGELRHVKRL